MQTPLQSRPSDSRQPSSLACVPCRHRHLKCDATMPVCGRCQDTGSECRYVRSRRGQRQQSDNHPRDLANADLGLPMLTGADVPLPEFLSASALADLDVSAYDSALSTAVSGIQSSQATLPALSSPQTLDLPGAPGASDALVFPMAQPDKLVQGLAYDPMIQLYYQGFHRSHPFVVPRRALNSPLARCVPESTLSIMRYIGAHYHSDPVFQEIFRHPAYAGLADESVFPGFRVQNMLLLAIVEHARADEDSALHTLQMAITLALEVGMNKASFAAQNAWGSAVLEESWRRTFWELYVINGMLAAMRDQKSFMLRGQAMEVGLPCDEATYNSCNMIPLVTKSIDDLKAHWSHGDHQRFSSFAYRIEAARVVGAVLTLNDSLDINEDNYVETTEAALVASLLHFPVSQGEPYTSNDFDDMIFQAQMLLYLGMIHLHHPRSNLRLASFRTKTSCMCFRALEYNPSADALELDLHSQKLLRAANQLSSLATLPGPVKHRTPFFSCALAMAVIVHVAGCLMVSESEKEEPARARIQLGLGALNVLGKVWPLPGAVRKQLVGIYHEVGLGANR